MVKIGWDYPSHPTNKQGGTYMFVTILQILLKLGILFGLGFMVVCTAFVLICIIRGDIKVNMVRNETEKENK